MKLLFINAVSEIRSTGRQISEMTDYISKKGHVVYSAYSVGPKVKNGYKIGNKLDRLTHSFLSRLLGKQGHFSKISTRRLLLYIDKIEPDIIHLHNLHANYINLNLLLEYIAKKGIPVVITLHDCWFYTGKCTHYSLDKCQKWTNNCGNCPRLRKDNVSWFFDRTSQLLDNKKRLFDKIENLTVVGVSNWISNEARKSILGNSNIITIYNWINTNDFKYTASKYFDKKHDLRNKFIILSVASIWSSDKGFDKFLELSKVLDKDSIIVLVGNIKGKHKLPSNIINIKELHDIHQLTEIYSSSDVYLNLSEQETFGKVVIEAMACGLPVISNSGTANPEIVDEKCGVILDDLSIENIKQALITMRLADRQSISKSCRLNVLKRFDMQDKIEEYMNTYSKILEKSETL